MGFAIGKLLAPEEAAAEIAVELRERREAGSGSWSLAG
jgi:hypothetical protein